MLSLAAPGSVLRMLWMRLYSLWALLRAAWALAIRPRAFFTSVSKSRGSIRASTSPFLTFSPSSASSTTSRPPTWKANSTRLAARTLPGKLLWKASPLETTVNSFTGRTVSLILGSSFSAQAVNRPTAANVTSSHGINRYSLWERPSLFLFVFDTMVISSLGFVSEIMLSRFATTIGKQFIVHLFCVAMM